MNYHSPYIQRCRELASESAQTGNTPVGAVVVWQGLIIGEGREATRPQNDITYHAEVEAIRAALQWTEAKLWECDLYTTHEPCILCSYMIRHYRLARVLFDVAVPGVGGVNSPYPVLTATDISVWGPPPILLTFNECIVD